ncbi:MAG: amidohydrolase family protein [Candidatus Hadarchaeia archaeon]
MDEKIFKNAIILRGPDLEPVEGFIRIGDGVIKEISSGEPSEFDSDLSNSIIMPPFVNAHTHVGDSVKRDIYAGRSQPEVVGSNGSKFRALEQSSRSSKVEAINRSLRLMRDSGTIAHIDFREEGLCGISLLRDAEVSGIESLCLARLIGGEDIGDLLDCSQGIGIPSLESYSSDEVEEISNSTNSRGKLLSFHVSETKSAHEHSLSETGKTEIERALEYDPDFLIHGVWAEREDLARLKERNVPLVVCPRSNSLLSTGIPPLSEAIQTGVELWIGTDNASVCSPIMFQELSYAWMVLRLQDEKAGEFEARELLKSATIYPSENLNLKGGPLEEGGRANFFVLSRDQELEDCENIHVGIVNRARERHLKKIFHQ